MTRFGLRVRTAAFLFLLLVPALALREAGISERLWVVLVSVACTVAVWEWFGLFGLGSLLRSVALAACAYLAFALSTLLPALTPVLWLMLGLWGVALLRIVGAPFPASVERVLFGMLGLIAIPVTGLILVDLSGAFLWAFFAVVIVADTAAYILGRRYGRTALAPEISPGKTRAGLGGALLTVAVLSLPMAWGLDLPPAAWFYFMCLALLTACFSVVGDLTVSLAKRRANVKDSGQLLPGHGGILDRADGMLAAAPVYALGILALQAVMRS